MCHSRWFLCFPSTWSQTGRRVEMIYTHKGKTGRGRREGGRVWVGRRERKKNHKRPWVRKMSSFWWKYSSRGFCYGSKWWNCFQSEKPSLLSLRFGNGGKKYLWANSTKRHNSVMQIFPLYLCTVIQPTQRRPQACWGTCFPVFSYIVLQTWRMLLCGLPQILITVVHQFICFFFIRWKQNIQYVGDLQFAVCSYWGKRPELKEGKCLESEK